MAAVPEGVFSSPWTSHPPQDDVEVHTHMIEVDVGIVDASALRVSGLMLNDKLVICY
jgi:hypothetical protein